MAPSPAPDVPTVVAGLRRCFEAGTTRPLTWRRTQLEALRTLLTEGHDRLCAALAADLGKVTAESEVTEIAVVAQEIDHTLAHLRGWLRPRRVRVPAVLQPARARTLVEPLGVVLVIGTWNYPVQLTLAPLVGALAAGNAVVVKPSEIAPATAAALAELLPRYLDPDAVAVVQGDQDTTTALLEQRLDHVFFTGSGRVGAIIAAEAAKRLVPVTLELGGKSPVWVDDSVDLERAARRIAWGKFVNAGQTCVAPDYLLATAQVAAALEPLLAAAIEELYGADPATHPDYGRIVNDRQFDRLVDLLDSGRTVAGGASDRATRYLAPTVLTDVARDSPVMAAEIFGPILPLVTVTDLDDAVSFVAGRDKPLTLYVFSAREDVRQAFTTRTSSGSLCFDAPLVNLMVPDLPFGGVGASGTGSYHGRRSLLTFSHTKAILDKPLRPDTLRLVYPPFTALRRAAIRCFFPG